MLRPQIVVGQLLYCALAAYPNGILWAVVLRSVNVWV